MSKDSLKDRLEEMFSSLAADRPVDRSDSRPVPPAEQTPSDAETSREAPPVETGESSRAQTLETSRQSEEKYRTILENIEDGYYEVDLKGSFTFFNDALCRILGSSREELTGMNYREYMDSESAERAYRAFNAVYRTGESLKEFEYILVKKTGEKRHIDISVSLIRDAGGEPIGFRGMLRDMTERRQAEADLLRFRLGIEQSTEAIFMTDTQGAILYTNPAFEKIYGYSQEEALGKTPRILKSGVIPQETYEQFWSTLLNKGVVAGEIVNKTKDGRLINIEGSNSPIVDEKGDLIGFLAVHRDITQRKQEDAERERRTVQTQAAAEIARAATSILDADELLNTTVNLIRDRLNLYYVGLFLVDEARENAVLRAGTGETGRAMLERRHHLAIGGSSMIGWCIANQKARIALDVGEEVVRFENPALPETRSELALPLISHGQALGAMTVQSAEEAAFGEADVAVLQTMADQIANAIANADLLEETRAYVEEATALNYLSRALASRLGVDQVLDEVYRGVSRLLDTTNFYFGLYDPHRNQVTFPINVTESVIDREITTIPADQGLTGYVIHNRASLLIREDVAAHLSKLGIQPVGEIAKSWLGVPLMLGDQVLGVMAVQSYAAHRLYDEHDRDMLTAIASQAAIAIQNARLFEETQQRNAELATLNQIISSASQTLDLRALLDMVLKQTLEVFGFDGGLITMYNDARRKLERVVRTGLPGEIPDDPAEGLENSLCAYVFDSRQPLLIEDFRQGAPIDVSGEIEAGYYSYIGVPLEARGRMLGTLCGFRKSAGPFGKNTLELLQTVGRQVGFAIQNAQLFEQTQAGLADTRTRAQRERLVGEIVSKIRTATSVEEVLRVATDELRQVTGTTRAVARLSAPTSDGGNGHAE